MYNKIVLVGNLTRDIELRYIQSGTAVANTAIATSRKFTSNGEKKEEVMFIDITFFGRSGEIANQYLRKGSKILVEGRLKFDQWVDQNGQKRSKHSVNVENMQMLDSHGDAQGQGQAPQNPNYQGQQQQGNGTNGTPQQNYRAPQNQQNGANGGHPQQGQQPNYQNQQQRDGANGGHPQQGQHPNYQGNGAPQYDENGDEIPF
jgi:single-strand DNA-binding protein